MQHAPPPSPAEAWARLRFAVIGPLLSSPPPRGQLAREIARLSEKTWRHPTTGALVQFARSTIETWYYRALRCPGDPVGALRRQVRADCGNASTEDGNQPDHHDPNQETRR